MVISGDYIMVNDQVRPWKSPMFNGNESSDPDDWQGRTVNLLEGTYYGTK